MTLVAAFGLNLFAAPTEEEDRIRQSLIDNAKIPVSLGPMDITVVLTTSKFPDNPPEYVDEEIERKRAEVKAAAALRDYSDPDELESIEYNVRLELEAQTIERLQIRILRVGDRWRIEQRLLDFQTSLVIPERHLSNSYLHLPTIKAREMIYTWDGSVGTSIHLSDDPLQRSCVIENQHGPRGYMDLLFQLGRLGDVTLEAVEKGEWKVRVQSIGPDGVVITVGDSVKVVAATIVGWMLLQKDNQFADGHRYRAQCSDYHLIDGIWLPFRSVEEEVFAEGADDHVMWRREWEVQNATFRAILSDDIFRPAPPLNAAVLDRRYSPPLDYRTLESGRTDHEAQIAAVLEVQESQVKPAISGGPGIGKRWRGFLIGVGVCAALIGALILIKGRKYGAA